MKKTIHSLLMAGALCAGMLDLNAADKPPGGPKGGRLLEKTEPNAEFTVEKDHSATIAFYDSALKPVPAEAQTVTVIANTGDNKVTVEFEKKGDILVSKSKLPEGDGYNLVLQLRQTPESKPQNFRFKLDLHPCGGCQRAEYACTCSH